MNQLICLISLISVTSANWDHWWTYDGISGPAYWGLINPAWTMCNKVNFININIFLQLRFFDMPVSL